MSEIRATTISDTAGTGPITLTAQSSAKTWALWTTVTTTTLQNSLNVSSLTDLGAGYTEVNLTTAFSDTTYAYACSSASYMTTANNSAKAASSFREGSYNSSFTLTDSNEMVAIAHGDLA